MNGYYIEKSSQLFPISPKDRTWAAAIYAKRTKWMLFDHEDDDCDGDDDNQTASGIEKTWNAIWGASFWYKKKKVPRLKILNLVADSNFTLHLMRPTLWLNPKSVLNYGSKTCLCQVDLQLVLKQGISYVKLLSNV